MVTVDLDDERFDGVMDKVRSATSNMKPVLQLMSIKAIQIIDRKFSQEGPGWKKLSPKWESRRAKLGRSGKILQLNGDLRKSVVAGEGNADGAFSITEDADGATLTIGSRLKYARTHQLGDPSRNIPARPYMPTQDEVIKPFKSQLVRYLRDLMSGNV